MGCANGQGVAAGFNACAARKAEETCASVKSFITRFVAYRKRLPTSRPLIFSNPVIKRFAERLRAAGKPFKVMLIAAMRKLLTILNLMLKENRPWDPKLQTA